MNQILFFGLSALIKFPDNLAHQPNQSPCLLKILILLKPGIQIFDRRMKRVGIHNPPVHRLSGI